MKNFIKISALLIFTILISNCKKNFKLDSEALSAPKSQSISKALNLSPADSIRLKNALDTDIEEYRSLLDTNKMNPDKMEAFITYSTQLKRGAQDETRKKMAFLKQSEFPVLNDMPSAQNRGHLKKGQTLTDYNEDNLTMSVDAADIKYRRFVGENKNHKYLKVYQQNTSTLMIRKFFLNHAEKNADLKFYLEELLKANSQDYPLIYMAMKQLRNSVPRAQLDDYKKSVKNNADAKSTIRRSQVFSNLYLAKSKEESGLKSEIALAASMRFKIPAARLQFFANKIYSL